MSPETGKGTSSPRGATAKPSSKRASKSSGRSGRIRSREASGTAGRENSYEFKISKVVDAFSDGIRVAVSAGRLGEDFDAVDVARRAVASIPQSNALADDIGPFYDTSGLVKWLNISKQGLAKRVEKNQMVGCKTSDGHWVYPAFQFTDTGDVVTGVPEVLDVLVPTLEAWAAARWFVTPSPDLPSEMSAIDWLAQGHDFATVVTEARRDTERLAS